MSDSNRTPRGGRLILGEGSTNVNYEQLRLAQAWQADVTGVIEAVLHAESTMTSEEDLTMAIMIFDALFENEMLVPPTGDVEVEETLTWADRASAIKGVEEPNGY
jgi:hypothetical protein